MGNGNGGLLVPYYRQSRKRSERTISIEEQRRDVQQWAKANDVELAPEIVEQNVSGSKPWRERDLGEAIEACERGEAAGIIVAWQDRLSRENGRATAEVWEALEQSDARLVCSAEGLDTATGDHEMLFTIKAAIARDQWKRKQREWANARRNATERGVYVGRIPTGYDRDPETRIVVISSGIESQQMTEAFESRAEGVPFAQIARRYGWTVGGLRLRLKNPVYMGANPLIPALVSRDLYERANAARTTRPVPAGDTTKDFMLVGRRLVLCAGCDKTLKVVQRKKRNGEPDAPAYYCHNATVEECSARAFVEVARLEEYVCAAFESHLHNDLGVLRAVASDRALREAEKERDQLERNLRDFVKRSASLGLGELFEQTVREQQEEIERAQARVIELRGRIGPTPPVSGRHIDIWPTLDAAGRGELLASALDRIVVAKGAQQDLAANVSIFGSDGLLIVPADEEVEVRVAAA